MGASSSTECSLSAAEIEEFVSKSTFTAEEVKALHFHFKTINQSHEHITRK